MPLRAKLGLISDSSIFSKHVKLGRPEAEHVHMLSPIIHPYMYPTPVTVVPSSLPVRHRSGSVESGKGISSGWGLAAGVIQGASSGRRSACCCFARLLTKPLGGDSHT